MSNLCDDAHQIKGESATPQPDSQVGCFIGYGCSILLPFGGRSDPLRLSDVQCNQLSAADEARPILRLFGIPYALPSTFRFFQALPFYPALAYGLNNDGIDGANFRIIGIGNRRLSGFVYGVEVARGLSKQNRHNAWGGRLGKIADPEFHARQDIAATTAQQRQVKRVCLIARNYSGQRYCIVFGASIIVLELSIICFMRAIAASAVG